jgi:hypothetical protein
MRPPPSTYFPCNLYPHRPSHVELGHPFLYLYAHPQLFFIYLVIVQNLCFQPFLSFFVVTFGNIPFVEKATHVALGWGIHYLILLLTLSINPEYLTVQLPLISEFVHFVTPLAQLNPSLVVPLMLYSVPRLLSLILHKYSQPRAVLSLTAF